MANPVLVIQKLHYNICCLISSFPLTVTDDELEVAGVLGPKCTRIYFDDNISKKQVVCIISLSLPRGYVYASVCWFVSRIGRKLWM